MTVDSSRQDLPTAIAVSSASAPTVAPRPPAPGRRVAWRQIALACVWIALALAALYQLGLLTQAIAGRVRYPYDLEWMEGGMLQHAQRIRHGDGIYVAPNIDFIPYLYTPLYPTLIALFGGLFGGPFGPSYTLGRVISVLALCGIVIAALGSFTGTEQRRLPAMTGLLLGLGLFAACYPFVDGWYDIVRADTLFLFMITAGIAGLPKWAAADEGWMGHGKVCAGAALMALAFFCKQTGIIYVALGGLIVLVVNWRRVPAYVGMAALVGLGGTELLNRSTHGWFWTYVSEIHRAHDFHMPRFWASFPHILWHFPAATIVIAATLLLVAISWRRPRGIAPPAQPFVLWTAAYAVSTVVGAVGWGTEFAHFNAYMPALLHGGLAAGAAVPAVLACVRVLLRDRRHAGAVAMICAIAAALPLAITCVVWRWQPQRFIPTAADVAAGGRLIERLKSIDGDIWMPSHPWYLVLAGKSPHVHRMGVKDVTTRQTRTIEGLDDKLKNHGFAAIVLDNRDLNLELPQLRQHYRPAFVLPSDERPRVYTGAIITPEAIWIPAVPATPPPNAKVLFDFEAAGWTDGWVATGAAWGAGPVTEAMRGQPPVLGATGLRFATSFIGGDAVTGRVSSPLFLLDGARLTLRLGGGADPTRLRAELWSDGVLARTASISGAGGDSLRTVTIELGPWRGKLGRLVLVDDSTTGHLNVDDVWLWQ